MGTHEFDLCVVGAGSAGFAAAVTARSLGKTVALLDGNGQLGGLCILRGCMPSKTELRSAEVAHLAHTASQVGIRVGSVVPDVAAVVERKRRIIEGFADYRVDQIKQFPLYQGAPRFTGRDEIEIGDDVIRARKFVISTGSLIDMPDIPGLLEAGFVNSDDVLEMTQLPPSFITLGGGPTACELSQYLHRMGASVSILQRSDWVLSQEDKDVGEALGGALIRDGIDLATGATIKRVERKGARKFVVARRGHQEIVQEADEIFMALGRRPYVEDFGFEKAGIAYDGNGVKVDEFMQTSNPDIYAAGDVTGSNELVHVAVYEGQLAARNAFAQTPVAANHDLWRARAVFTDPQVAVAGVTERECIERGIEHAVASYPFDDLGKAISTNQTEGFAKIIAAPDGSMLGVAIVGAEAADLIHEAIALLYFRANVSDIMEMPHLHPTLAEIMTYPAEELCERLERTKHVLVQP